MILKLRNRDGGWLYYDVSDQVTIRYNPVQPWDLSTYTAVWLDPTDYADLDKGQPKTGEPFVCCWFDKENREHLILAEVGYLLNNDGRTIEKL